MSEENMGRIEYIEEGIMSKSAFLEILKKVQSGEITDIPGSPEAIQSRINNLTIELQQMIEVRDSIILEEENNANI